MKAEGRGKAGGQGGAALRILPCACANLRRASRAVSQIYAEHLRGTGLNISQFTLLQALSLAGKVTQGRLGRILVLDSTTLTRTLRTLEGKGWIRRRPGADRRERYVELTRAGGSRFTRALPAWNRAQALLRARVGRRRWSGLMTELSRIAGLSSRT